MGRQGPGAQALDPQAAPRQKAAHPLATTHSLSTANTVYRLLTIGGCPVQAPLGRDTSYWLFATGYSLLPTPYWLLAGAPSKLRLGGIRELLPTPYCLLAGAPSKLSLGGIRELLSTPYCLLPTGYCLLATAYWLLPTGYCLLATAYWLLATPYYCLLSTPCTSHPRVKGTGFSP
jgi:hypothetical protein